MRKPRQPSLTRAMIAARFATPVKDDDLGAHKLRTPDEVEAALDCMMLERDEGDLWLFGSIGVGLSRAITASN